MAETATSDWSSGSAGGDWTQPSGMFGGGMWGAPSPYGMQQPYSSPYSGFGGGMPYGGGYPMQSPYGAYGGYGGGYSPYGMQSPYGGYSPYGMQSPYSAYGMPQQQMGAPQTMQALPTEEVEPGPLDADENSNYKISNLPWGPLGAHYENELFPRAAFELREQAGRIIKDENGRIIEIIPGQGPLGFDPSSELGLRRMEALANPLQNPLVNSATNAVSDITSGEDRVGEGGVFTDMYGLYHQPGISNAQQYQDLIAQGSIRNSQDYTDFADKNLLNAGMFTSLYGAPGISEGGYANLGTSGGRAVDPSLYTSIFTGSQGPGSLVGGRYGEVARGGLMDANPYREQAIEDAMQQTSDEVASTMSARGRYGSSAYGDAMGEALGRVATQARMAGYDTDTANMMAAAQGRSQEELARSGIRLQAAQGVAGAQQGNWANQLAAAQGLTGAQAQNAATRMAAARGGFDVAAQNKANQLAAAQGISALQGTNAAQRLQQVQGLSGVQGQNWQDRMAALQGVTGIQGENLQNRLAAAGMAPAMQQLRYDDSGRLLQAGAAREAMAQKQRDFTWDQLANYHSILGTLPGSAGSQQQETNKPWWETALGVAGTLGGIWGGLTPGGG